MCRRAYSCAVVAGALIAYFVIFPDDLAFLDRVFLSFVDRLLLLTQSVATGAWALLIALVIVGGAVRIWGGKVKTSGGDSPATQSPAN